MAYTSGGLIQAQDYNWLAWGGNTSGTYTTSVNNLAVVWGQGTGTYGYGQDVSAFSTVTATSTVTAAQWSGLVYHLNKTLGHQGGAGAQLASGSNIGITAGATVTSFANVSTAIGTIVTNRLTYNAQGSTTTGGNIDDSISTAGALSAAYNVKVTFASTDAARYFFNAGGELQYRVDTVNGGGNGRESSVDRLIDGIGGVNYKAQDNGGRTGSGITLNTNNTAIGYYDQTTSPQTLVAVTDTTAAYTSNTASLQVYTDDATTTRGSKGATVLFRINLSITDKTWDDTLSMTLRHRIDIKYPETTYLATTWGTPTSAGA